jgi:hypothetical protein
MENYYITLFSFSAAPAEYSFRPNIRPIIFGRMLGRKRFRSITNLKGSRRTWKDLDPFSYMVDAGDSGRWSPSVFAASDFSSSSISDDDDVVDASAAAAAADGSH